MAMPRTSRARLWAFAIGVAACMAVLCLAHQIPGFLGQPAPTAMAVPQPAAVPPTHAAPAAVEPIPATPSEPNPQPTATPEAAVPDEPITLTIVYDNNPLDKRLKTAWGFACWIDLGELTMLFDTGADGATLLGNLNALGYNPDEIDIVVLSHAHDDHTGGLQALLEVNDHLTVYMLSAFPDSLKARARERANLIEVDTPLQIADGVWSLGPMGTSPVEQSLAIQSGQGVVVVTGCAHPGIVSIVRAAREMGAIHLVLGGFHLGEKSASEIESVIAQLQDLGVERIAPCHCTGDQAIRMFAAGFGASYIPVGAGAMLSVPR
jgi:7,8-dihydropterin-6-yl-methyl-4-(beta-D-ribofuranosyl)aminobenzene 5'-phosphate synthase